MWVYFLNKVGPLDYDWIRKNGSGWITGRVECECDDIEDEGYSPQGREFPTGLMHENDWASMSAWAAKLRTKEVLTREEFIEMYQRAKGRKIRWFTG